MAVINKLTLKLISTIFGFIFNVVLLILLFSLQILITDQASAKSTELQDLTQKMERLEFEAAKDLGLAALENTSLPPADRVEIRRLSAKAAKESGDTITCLNLYKLVAAADISNEDLMAIGDCLPKSNYPKWTVQLFQNRAKNQKTSDISYYYLGCLVYSRGDYPKASRFFQKATSLPQRLAKDVEFKLTRIREITDVSQDSNKSSDQSSILQIPGRVFTNYTMNEKIKSDFLWSGRLETGIVLQRGRYIALKPHMNDEFDVLAKAGKANEASLTIKKKLISSQAPYFETQTQLQYLGLSGDSVSTSLFRNTTSLTGGFTFSEITDDFYAIEGRESRPSLPMRSPVKGYAIYADNVLEMHPNKTLFLGIQLTATQTSAGFGESINTILSSFYGSAQSRYFRLVFGYDYISDYGEDRQLANAGGGIWSDFYLFELGYFALAPPPGYRTFRFMRLVPQNSSSVVKFTSNEGEFFELNISPKITFDEKLYSLLWFRYVAGTKRSYVTGNTADKVAERTKLNGNSKAFVPDSNYESTSSEWRVQTYLTTHGLFGSSYPVILNAGITLRTDTSRYTQDQNNGLVYADLIDQGGGSISSLVLGARLEL